MGPFNSQRETSFPEGGEVPVIEEGSGTLETKIEKKNQLPEFSFIENKLY
jgi:hypothetical protein